MHVGFFSLKSFKASVYFVIEVKVSRWEKERVKCLFICLLMYPRNIFNVLLTHIHTNNTQEKYNMPVTDKGITIQ